MPISKDIQDFCAALPGAVTDHAQRAADAATAAALAQAAKDHAAEIAALKASHEAELQKANDGLAQAVNDHAEEVEALKAALAKATTPPDAAPPTVVTV